MGRASQLPQLNRAGLSAAAGRWCGVVRPWLLHPLWLVVVAVAIPQWTREQYPFSHFPMYSSFGGEATYLYLTDADDQTLPTLPYVGLTAAKVNKTWNFELKKKCKERGERR